MAQVWNRIDSNLIADNIRQWVSIYWISWNLAVSWWWIMNWVAWSVPNVYWSYFAVWTWFWQPIDFCFNENTWTTLYVMFSSGTVYRYTLSTAWDITTAWSATSMWSISGTNTWMCFSTDWMKFYTITVYSTIRYVNQYNLTTAYNLASWVTAYNSLQLPPTLTWAWAKSVAFNNAWTKLYVLDTINKKFVQWTVSPAWDVWSAVSASKSLTVSSLAPYWCVLKADDTRLYTVDQTSKSVYQYTMSTPWDLNTATNTAIAAMTSIPVTPVYCPIYKPDWTKCFVLSGSNIYQWAL